SSGLTTAIMGSGSKGSRLEARRLGSARASRFFLAIAGALRAMRRPPRRAPVDSWRHTRADPTPQGVDPRPDDRPSPHQGVLEFSCPKFSLTVPPVGWRVVFIQPNSAGRRLRSCSTLIRNLAAR